MTDYDNYLMNYLYHSFKNMGADRIPRDRRMEEEIILASKVEYCLESDKSMIFQLFNNKLPDEIQIGTDKKQQQNILLKNGKVYGGTTTLAHWGIPEAQHIPLFHFPMIDFYCTYQNRSFVSVVNQIARAFEITVNQSITPCIDARVFSGNSSTQSAGQRIFWYDTPSDFGAVFVYYFTDKKFFIPFHVIASFSPQCFAFFMAKGEKHPLFNFSRLCPMHKQLVILTDSIELAQTNQVNLLRADVYDIVWISWYGEWANIEKIDWSPLKGARVYYLLKEHSGFGGRTVYETALAVKQQLDKVGVAEFKYISYLAAGINRTTQSSVVASVPTLYCPDEFEVAMTQEQRTLPITLAAFKDDLARLTCSRKILLTPLIRERSATLIWGKPQSGKTWFAANMAMAMAIGKPALKGWCPQGRSSTILYIHGEAEGDRSLEGKLIVLSKTFPASSQGIILPQPLVSGAALSPIVWYKKHPANFFYWPIDKRQHISDDRYFTDIIQLAQTVTNSSPPGTIILDNVFSIAPSAWTLQNVLIRELKSAGWAVIIVAAPASSLREVETPWLNQPSVRVKVKPEFINHAYVDSIIKVKKRSCKDGKLTLGINIKSPWCAGSTSKFDCFIDFTATPAIFEKVKQNSSWAAALKKPRQQLISEIKWWDQQGAKERQIAETLGITLSMVKKLKREAGLTKRRSKPYQYPANLRYPSLSK